MTWTETTRDKLSVNQRVVQASYASDMSDGEWALIEPFLPTPHKECGRPRKTDFRDVMDGLLYMATTGCQWRQIPKDFPTFTILQNYFYTISRSGLCLSINHMLVMNAREKGGHEASPTAGMIDSQTVRTTESGRPRGYDGGKKIKGRKRHIMTDTEGKLVGIIVHPADIQDRDSAPQVLKSTRLYTHGCVMSLPMAAMPVTS